VENITNLKLNITTNDNAYYVFWSPAKNYVHDVNMFSCIVSSSIFTP